MRFNLVSVWKKETKMGTYTTNYQLFMPTVGETGWGTLVNGNFSTIDTAMKGLDTRISALEPLSVIQVDENQNVTFPAKIVADEFVGSIGNFEKMYLPLSINGSFAVGKVSMTTLIVSEGSKPINTTLTRNLGIPLLSSDIPTTLYNGIPEISKTVNFTTGGSNVTVTKQLWQNDTLIFETTANGTTVSCELFSFDDPVTLITIPSQIGTINYNFTISKPDTTFYIP